MQFYARDALPPVRDLLPVPVRQVLQAVVLLQLGGDQGLPVALELLRRECGQLFGKVCEEGFYACVQVRRRMRACNCMCASSEGSERWKDD